MLTIEKNYVVTSTFEQNKCMTNIDGFYKYAQAYPFRLKNNE